MVAETRSQRQQACAQQRPPYPQIDTQTHPTSGAQSVFQSSTSSLSSVSSLGSSGFMAQIQTQNMLSAQHNFGGSAPLPSPSAGHQHQMQMSYFASLSPQAAQGPTSHPAQSRIPPQHQGVAGGAYMGQRGDGGGMPETAPYLQDFRLLEEAAKRAQMACLSRDLGDIGL
ncbi:hypothetical protein LTR91_009551 [Friedmanniomyces endolithicus]|uniref:Uncharacterized protein n=1 Tax=Friedmanniomyces endolithicus TaxID=329885 RepID=A0AAN6KLH9_9PEZI|nr:hypothetical protein LTR38_016103 [Friedmanniomyces endolithicus]KAK0796806.1 hypothetical protein LTR59_006947 [Friedmanniomyces endolithicus]KAK0807874.1 hypothetical protein LTR75_006509 [Friedmanniomyces endolithicus]KAK0837438.1 hypothetical protein LTR03_012835 [Friedmanniomyces endolithicus]KAK0864758.1 hypothetical protein LTR87_015685 [Friedmanniomyces endolithicus]